MLKSTEELFVEIIRDFMDIPQQNIWVRDQNRKIPNDQQIYIVVGMVDSKTYSAKYEMVQRYSDDPTPVPYQVEITTTNIRENIQIDIMSRSNQAILRKNEVYLSLNSIASKQKQEEYNFKISRLPTNFVNTSGAEGGSNLNRFTMTVPTLVWYKKERVDPQYFELFQSRIDDEQTIGTDNPIIEFEIDPSTPEPIING